MPKSCASTPNLREKQSPTSFEKIEDQQDLATLREAIAADNGVRYTHEQVLAQLGL